MTHTPGPWEIENSVWTGKPYNLQRRVVLNGIEVHPSIIAKFDREYHPREADARLIAAAPMLLEACELFAKWMVAGQPGPHSDSVVLEHARMAIEMAKGKANE